MRDGSHPYYPPESMQIVVGNDGWDYTSEVIPETKKRTVVGP